METNERPPFFNTWSQVYVFIAMSLLGMIFFLNWFSRLY